MERNHQRQLQQSNQIPSEENGNNQGYQGQVPPPHTDPGRCMVFPTQNVDLHSIQPPAFLSASQQTAHLANSLYAIQTSVEPVARESDSEFFEYLNDIFSEGNDGPPSHPNANVQYLLDPIAWLPKEASPPEKATVPTATGHITSEQLDTQVSSSKSFSTTLSNRKMHPVKAVRKSKASVGGSVYRRQAKTGSSPLSPFEFLKNLLSSRGYSFGTVKSVEAGYLLDPSPLQLASFGTKMVRAAHSSDVALLTSLLGCGLSPNPCNQFRDSVMDWVLRKANEDIFRCFLDHHADLKVCDSFGRTPLHQTAWADTFSPAIASAILQYDPAQLFLEDNSGRTPLEYVSPKLTTQWIAFIENHKEELFPLNGPPLAVTKRQLSQLPDPPNAISVDLAQLVSSGQLQPEQITAMDEFTRKTWKVQE